MASITRRTKSKYWTACYTDRDGRQLKRSTKTTDRNEAMQIAAEIERVEQQARQGTLVTTQLRKVLSDVSEKVTGNSLSLPNVSEYLEQWLEGLEASVGEDTLVQYRRSVRLFVESLDGKAKKPISSVTPQDVEDFRNARLKSGVAPKTAINDLKVIKAAFSKAEKYGTILKSPAAPVALPKEDSTAREVFTHEEVGRLVEAAPTIEWQTLVLVGYLTGARLGDCARMRWENVFPELGFIRYQQEKTGKAVTIPMHFHLTEHLNCLMDGERAEATPKTGHLCPKLAERKSGGKGGLSETFLRIMDKAGLDRMTVQGKGKRKFARRSFHSLRHSFNSIMANAGVAEEVRMKLTGHKSRAMNERYTHLQLATLRSAVEAVPLFAQKRA